MKARDMLGILGAAALGLVASGAAAQAPQPVELKGDVKVDRIVLENGTKRHVLVVPDVVVPGDRLVFSTAYRNVGTSVVKDFVVTNPLPQGVMLAPDSAATQEVSVDGGKSWGKLAALLVNDGKGGLRAAQASDVTHVRWTLAVLAAGAQGTLAYDAIVR